MAMWRSAEKKEQMNAYKAYQRNDGEPSNKKQAYEMPCIPFLLFFALVTVAAVRWLQ
jgi:hypothetical protein